MEYHTHIQTPPPMSQNTKMTSTKVNLEKDHRDMDFLKENHLRIIFHIIPTMSTATTTTVTIIWRTAKATATTIASTTATVRRWTKILKIKIEKKQWQPMLIRRPHLRKSNLKLRKQKLRNGKDNINLEKKNEKMAITEKIEVSNSISKRVLITTKIRTKISP